jgi:hypothetical protein
MGYVTVLASSSARLPIGAAGREALTTVLDRG